MRHTRASNIHPTAIIGNNVKLGKNVTILPYAVIGLRGHIREQGEAGTVVIGDNNIIGSFTSIQSGDGQTIIGIGNIIMNNVNIGHECRVGNNCEIGAGTVLSGHVQIQDNVMIKIGCVIRNRVTIMANTIIGMGSVVTSDCMSDSVYKGNPAKR